MTHTCAAVLLHDLLRCARPACRSNDAAKGIREAGVGMYGQNAL